MNYKFPPDKIFLDVFDNVCYMLRSYTRYLKARWRWF